jgi:hypothetical protein
VEARAPQKRLASSIRSATAPLRDKAPDRARIAQDVDHGAARERSFKDEVRNGRTAYGSGKKLAQDAQLKLTVDKRAGDKTFADYMKAGKANFGEAAEGFIARLQVNDRSRKIYQGTYDTHVKPVFGGRTLAQVAGDRDGVLDLLTVITMAGLVFGRSSESSGHQLQLVMETGAGNAGRPRPAPVSMTSCS